jgi:hypothetical protein
MNTFRSANVEHRVSLPGDWLLLLVWRPYRLFTEQGLRLTYRAIGLTEALELVRVDTVVDAR